MHRATSARSPPWLHATYATAPRATVAHATRAAVPRAAVAPHDAVALRDPLWPRRPAVGATGVERHRTLPTEREEGRRGGRGCDGRRGREVRARTTERVRWKEREGGVDLFGLRWEEWLRQKGRLGVKP